MVPFVPSKGSIGSALFQCWAGKELPGRWRSAAAGVPKGALNLDWAGICRGLRVFLDLGLIEAEGTSNWEKADSIWVRLLPAPKNKLDLTRSISFNECVKWRAYLDSYGQWALETPVSPFQEQDAWRIVLGA